MSYHFYDMGFKDGYKKALQESKSALQESNSTLRMSNRTGRIVSGDVLTDPNEDELIKFLKTCKSRNAAWIITRKEYGGNFHAVDFEDFTHLALTAGLVTGGSTKAYADKFGIEDAQELEDVVSFHGFCWINEDGDLGVHTMYGQEPRSSKHIKYKKVFGNLKKRTSAFTNQNPINRWFRRGTSNLRRLTGF